VELVVLVLLELMVPLTQVVEVVVRDPSAQGAAVLVGLV